MILKTDFDFFIQSVHDLFPNVPICDLTIEQYIQALEHAKKMKDDVSRVKR